MAQYMYPPQVSPGTGGIYAPVGGRFVQAPAGMQSYQTPSVYGYGMPYASPYSTLANQARLQQAQQNVKGATIPIDKDARKATWFFGGLQRAELKRLALDVMQTGQVGEFFIRDVTSQPNCLGLSIKLSETNMTNYLLLPQKHKGKNGVSIRGTSKTFSNLSELVKYYAKQHRPALPCKLIIPKQRAKSTANATQQDMADIYSTMSIPSAADQQRQHEKQQAKIAARQQSKAQANAALAAELAAAEARLAAEKKESEDALDMVVKRTEDQLRKQREAVEKERSVREAVERERIEAEKKVEVERTKAAEERERLLIAMQERDEALEKERQRVNEMVAEKSVLIEKVSDLYSEVLDVRQTASDARHIAESVASYPTKLGSPPVELSRKQARHRAAIESRKANQIAQQAKKLQMELGGSLMVHEPPTPTSPRSPTSPGDGEQMFLMDQLERERGSDIGVPIAHPHYGSSGSRSNNNSLSSRTSSNHKYGTAMEDPAVMWNMISNSKSSKAEKLAAAKAHLEYLKREEHLVLEKLKYAESIAQQKRAFSEDETVFDDDFENATIIDHDTGETFGFGGFLGSFNEEEEEVYGFE